MTRKDYQLLTDVLKDRRQNSVLWYKLHGTEHEREVVVGAIDDLTDFLAYELAQDNKAFDKDKFINDIRGKQ